MISDSVFIRLIYAESANRDLHLLIFSNTGAVLKTKLNLAIFPGFIKGDVFTLEKQGFEVVDIISRYEENKYGMKTAALVGVTYYVKAKIDHLERKPGEYAGYNKEKSRKMPAGN